MNNEYLVINEFYHNGYRLLELDRKVPFGNKKQKVCIDGTEYPYFRNSIESWLGIKGLEFSCIGKKVEVV